MIQFVYDSSFAGFFTAVFDLFFYKDFSARIVRQESSTALFAHNFQVITDTRKAERVLRGLRKRISPSAFAELYAVWLSELDSRETILLGYSLHIFQSQHDAENDFSNSFVLDFKKTAKMVSRERHRMKAFVRFSRLQNDLYYAVVEPDFNVLPLIESHFRLRYAGQQWLIYDRKRKYGLFYNLNHTETVEIDFTCGAELAMLHTEEVLFRSLWKNYFSSVNIKSRKNTPLHLRHIPVRYWKLLTEKC